MTSANAIVIGYAAAMTLSSFGQVPVGLLILCAGIALAAVLHHEER